MNKEQKERDHIARKDHQYLYMKKVPLTSKEESKIGEENQETECNGLINKEEEQPTFPSKDDTISLKDDSILNTEMKNQTESISHA